MKTFRQGMALLTVSIVSIGLMTSILTQSSPSIQAASSNEPDICLTCTYTTSQTAVTISDDQLAFRHLNTYGVTEEPYIIDTVHHDGPYGIEIDSSDNLWITEIDSARVLKFDSSGLYQSMLGQTGLKRDWGNYLVAPVSTAVDSSGNAWVADRDTHRVKQYDSLGNVIMTLGEAWVSGSDNTHFDWPHGVAVDSSDNVYIAERNNHRVQIFDSSGVYLATIGESAVAGDDNAHFNGPVHIDIDNANRLYVADRGNERIQIFDVSNPAVVTYLATLGTTGESGTDNAHFNAPYGVTADATKIYVADLSNHRIQIFDAASYVYQGTLGGTQGTGNNQFQLPIDVAVNSSGIIYVADIGNERVQVFNSSYTYVRTMGVTGIPYITDDNHYNLPFHADATEDGGWVVAEKDGHRVIKHNIDGTQAWVIGEPGIPGDDNTHFNLPHGVAERSNHVIYVADTGNHRIVRYAPDGSYLGEWGGYGTGENQFDWPTAIAFGQNSDILVVDTNNRRVQIYDLNFFYKATLGVTGEEGSDNGHFGYPLDVAVDSDGNIYVADQGNQRIQVFNSSYVYQKTIGVTGECGNDGAHLCGPHALDFDDQDRLYVADSWNQRVQIFDASDNYLYTIGGHWGGLPGQFRTPQGVVVSKSGLVLVSDSENHRLQIFEPFANTWNQINTSGFGNPQTVGITSFDLFQNQLYAGTGNFEQGARIWRSDNGVSWTPVSDFGFSSTYTNTNESVTDLTSFNGKLYAGTGWNSGQIWRTTNGVDWSQLDFGNSDNFVISRLIEFNDQLYALLGNDVTGMEIRRSSSGDSGSWEAVVTNGHGDDGNTIASGIAIFDGYLYIGIENAINGSIIWRTNNGTTWTNASSSGFGDADNIHIGSLAVFNNTLYASTRNNNTGAQIWRSENGTNWSQVIDNGFGDSNNGKIESLFEFNQSLHAITYNGETGMEVWRSADGTSWQQINTDGFGDSSNYATLWNSATIEFEGHLLVGTWNEDNGGELWQFTAVSSLYLPFITR